MQTADCKKYANADFPTLLQRSFLPLVNNSRRLIRHAGHGPRGVVLASCPEVAADLGGLAKGHADARGAEEGVGGTVVFAEVEVDVGACLGFSLLILGRRKEGKKGV